MTSPSTPEGPGSVSGAPNLPAGFTDTFTSRYVDTGELRLHAVTGGDGPPLLLVHGWPQTWYAWRLMMPALARDFSVVAVDQRGIGLSDKPRDGYDTATLASDLVALMDALGHQRFALYGTDVGMPIAYALAADHRGPGRPPGRLRGPPPGHVSLTAAVPAPAAQRPALAPRLQPAPARSTNSSSPGGRTSSSARSSTPRPGRTSCPTTPSSTTSTPSPPDPDALRGSFGFYRAIPTTIAQNEQRKTRRLTLPVLAIGGAESSGEGPGNTMKLAADDVQTMVLPGCGHWVAEQAPEELLAALTAFLAPYRDAAAAARNSTAEP